MYRRLLPYLTIVAILACNAENSTQPPRALPSSASPVISDGAHLPGNPDFFFLNPTVPNPKNALGYGNPFNGSLLAVVSICELDVVPPDANVIAASPCKSGGYTNPPTVASVDPVAEKYSVDWTVPVAAPVYYRIRVIVGSDTIGYADVKTGPTPQSLKGTDPNKLITRIDGSVLPIRFRIEEFALCDTPGLGPCASESVDENTGGTVQTTFTGDTGPTGIEIMPGSGNTTRVVTIEECPVGQRGSDRTDLPTFGRCTRITLDPPLGPGETFDVPAIAFICSAPAAVNAALSNVNQRPRVTMHRFDEPDEVTALPHVHPDACDSPGGGGAAQATLKGMLVDLFRGRFKSAGGQLVGMFSPKPLYATLMLDEGGGGETDGTSDFFYALPAKMTKDAATDNQVAPPGPLPTNPKVIVTDLAGDPVANARVHFGATLDPVCFAGGPSISAVVLSAADGSASTPWTIVAGPNSFVACGRGIADGNEATNGPRTGAGAFDPFQPIQTPFDPGPDPNPLVQEPVLVGSVTFTATGVVLFGSASAGTTGTPSTPLGASSLYSIHPSTGAGTLIGAINFNRVGAIDFHPSGVLYGIGQKPSDNTPVLLTINLSSGAGTEVGPTGTTGNISDIAFRSDGVLFLYDAISPAHKVYTVDLTTGAATLVGNTGLAASSGNGIAFGASNVLFHSNRNFSHTLNQTTGAATQVSAMSFPGSCTSLGFRSRVAASVGHPASGLFYGSIKCGGAGPGPDSDFFGTVNYSTGVVTIIGSTVVGLDGLARKN